MTILATPPSDIETTRRTARLRHIDRVAVAVITLGGISVVLAVLGILVFIGAEALPLFRGASMTPAGGATLPLGPALLSIESGAPMYVVGVRRSGRGRYRGRLEPIPMPPDGPRRERVMTATASVAAAFERIIADAPEQWWAVFFPIWPDLEGTATDAPKDAAATHGTARAAAGAAGAAGAAR